MAERPGQSERTAGAGANGQPAIEAVGLAKRCGSRLAVDDLSFSVAQGEVFGFLGPNGAGKTTAIRMLTTVLRPTAGSFSVAGVPQTEPLRLRAAIGVLPESAGFPERAGGKEYLRFHGRLFGLRAADARRRAAELLEEVGLTEAANQAISTYSRGMRQRLGIARALVHRPRVVFLDEPTLGLDPGGQRQVLGMIRRIAAEQGASVVLSTHLMREVEQTCSRLLILNEGKIAAAGRVAELLRASAAARTVRVAVRPDQVEAAEAVLRGLDQVEPEPTVARKEGVLRFRLAAGRRGGDGSINPVLVALAGAGMELLSFELEGGSLDEVFLATIGERDG